MDNGAGRREEVGRSTPPGAPRHPPLGGGSARGAGAESALAIIHSSMRGGVERPSWSFAGVGEERAGSPFYKQGELSTNSKCPEMSTNENININGQMGSQLHLYLCFWTIVDNGGLWTIRAARRWWGEPSGRAVRAGTRQGKRLAGDGSPYQGMRTK